MNFLTKFAIVLLVVVALLFTSGVIVFVNGVENFNQTIAKLQNESSIAKRQASEAKAEADTERSNASSVRIQTAAEVQRVRDQLSTTEAGLQKANVDIANVRQDLATANAQLAAATSATKVAQETNKLLQEQIAETRKAMDKLQSENTDYLARNSDLNARLQTALRANKDKDEQIDTLQTRLADADARKGLPVTDTGALDTVTPVPSSEVAINGVIRDVRTINGVQYATISVGSKDQVAKGTVFNVIQREGDGDFLGYLTVDRVEEREASGRLEGPKIDQMKPGDEVRTQL